MLNTCCCISCDGCDWPSTLHATFHGKYVCTIGATEVDQDIVVHFDLTLTATGTYPHDEFCLTYVGTLCWDFNPACNNISAPYHKCVTVTIWCPCTPNSTLLDNVIGSISPCPGAMGVPQPDPATMSCHPFLLEFHLGSNICDVGWSLFDLTLTE